MKKGEIYKAIYDSNDVFISLSAGGDKVESFITVNGEDFYTDLPCLASKCRKVEATPLEKKWLLTCIERNIFVPLEEIKIETFKFGR